MKWLYKGLMAVATVGASLVTAGVLPAAYGAVAFALGTAAAFFHESPTSTKTEPPK